jgi:hypothetical protein
MSTERDELRLQVEETVEAVARRCKSILHLFPSLRMLPFVISLLPAVNPGHARNITVYHVNEHKFGAIPLNMNTADVIGDLFFDLLEVFIAPLACANQTGPPKPGPNPCANPEAVGADLMVNKLTLEIDERYSGYAACNVGINGSDPFGHPCKSDTYCCFCHVNGSMKEDAPCNATLGYENVYEQFGQWITPGGCKPSPFQPHPRPSDCYAAAAFTKLNEVNHGSWYSSLDLGYCGSPGSACTWRVVSVDKIVQRSCHATVFGAAVQKNGDPGCLLGCGSQATNVSSPCYVDCFYKAALGPESGTVGGAIAGMSLDELQAAWRLPFSPESEGGCPAQPEWSPWFERRPAAPVGATNEPVAHD